LRIFLLESVEVLYNLSLNYNEKSLNNKYQGTSPCRAELRSVSLPRAVSQRYILKSAVIFFKLLLLPSRCPKSAKTAYSQIPLQIRLNRITDTLSRNTSESTSTFNLSLQVTKYTGSPLVLQYYVRNKALLFRHLATHLLQSPQAGGSHL